MNAADEFPAKPADSSDRFEFGRLYLGFALAAAIGVVGQFLPVTHPVTAALHAFFSVAAPAAMLATAAYGLRRMEGLRYFRWVIVAGIGGLTLHEFAYQIRYVPYLRDLSFQGISALDLGLITGMFTPAIGAAIGLGFMLALYQLERSRVRIAQEHNAFCEQAALRKRAEEERLALAERVHDLAKSESLIEMAGGVAHELGNLFTIVSCNTELLAQHGRLSNNNLTNLRAIERAATKGAELAAKMRAYAGVARSRQSRANLSAIIRKHKGVLETIKPQKIDLHLMLADDLPDAYLDEMSVSQAVSCLVINAFESIGDKAGWVIVSTGFVSVPAYGGDDSPLGNLSARHFVYVEIRDSGCGMDEDTKRRALDPFFSTKFLGRGLGLAIVQGVARSHEGLVEIESAPECGSAFRILIPCCGVDGGEGDLEPNRPGASSDTPGQSAFV